MCGNGNLPSSFMVRRGVGISHESKKCVFHWNPLLSMVASTWWISSRKQEGCVWWKKDMVLIMLCLCWISTFEHIRAKVKWCNTVCYSDTRIMPRVVSIYLHFPYLDSNQDCVPNDINWLPLSHRNQPWECAIEFHLTVSQHIPMRRRVSIHIRMVATVRFREYINRKRAAQLAHWNMGCVLCTEFWKKVTRWYVFRYFICIWYLRSHNSLKKSSWHRRNGMKQAWLEQSLIFEDTHSSVMPLTTVMPHSSISGRTAVFVKFVNGIHAMGKFHAMLLQMTQT